MATFSPTTIHDNPDGWGPPMDLAPAKFQDMPYAPFSKSDRLGKTADWTSHGGRGARDTPGDEQSSDFTMVDSKVLPRPSGYSRGRQGFRGSFRGRGSGMGGSSRSDRDGNQNSSGSSYNSMRRGGRGGFMSGQSGSNTGRNAGGNSGGGMSNNNSSNNNYRPRWEDRRNIQREPSIEVGTDWVLLEEMPSITLTKMPVLKTIPVEDIMSCGSLPYFNRSIDRVSVKAPKRLVNAANKITYPKVTTTDDINIRKIAATGQSNGGNIFATSSILALIMVAPRTVQSWDIIVQKIDNKLFLDKRDGSMADCITVNETSHDPPKDEKNLNNNEDMIMNSFQKLALEAASINQNFISQVVSQNDKFEYEEPSPFDDEVEEGSVEASVGYKYRRWDLGDDMVVVGRCELDAAYKPLKEGDAPEPIVIRALNEYFDPTSRRTSDWRGKLDTQRAAILATEVKNNAAKLSRWTAEAIMADAERIKFGFVSRVKSTDNENHVIIGSQMYRPKDFASQIALNTNKMWGILKGVMEICFKNLKDGEKGVLLKDPNKPIIRLYKIPDDALESNDDEEEDDDNDGQSGLFS